MDAKFPIFLRGRDGVMYCIKTSSDVNSELENLDIENKEYTAWDVAGQPIDLYLSAKEIKIKVLPNENRLNELIAYIRQYAKQMRPKGTFHYSNSENNPVILYKAVELYLAENTLRNKIKRLFDTFKTRNSGDALNSRQ